MQTAPLARALEAIGTFALVFVGAGAIMVNAKTEALGHVGIALTFGLVIMAMIYAVGHFSGAQFNPAVSFAFALTRHFPWPRDRLLGGSNRGGAGRGADSARLARRCRRRRRHPALRLRRASVPVGDRAGSPAASAGPSERAGFIEAPVIGPSNIASRPTVPPIAIAAALPTARVRADPDHLRQLRLCDRCDLEDCGCAYVDRHDRAIGQLSVDWRLAHTNKRAKAFMRELLFDQRFELGGKRIRLVHGSPRMFERIAALADCDILVFGHTHKPWVHDYGGVLFVNCGSVGKPKDGDPRASFATLTESDAGITVAIERVAYDALAVACEMRVVGLPEELADKLVKAA